MRWSLDETREVLGFSPEDGAPARLPLRLRLKEFGARLAQADVPRLVARLTGANW
jgi:NAD+ dependent glucose-6-phosphate dehydrogenase